MLTNEQLSILVCADLFGEPPSMDDLAKVPGFHFCPDWDDLPICDDSPEAEGCNCMEGAAKC